VSGTTTLTGAVSAPAGITADITGDLDGSVTGAVILAADGLDAVVTEAGLNARQMVSLIGDVLMGYLSGARPAGAQTIVIKDPTNTTTRVTITTDAFNNRTSVTLNPPA
jgi:hypothetical protein